MRRITSLGFFVTLLFVGAGALNAQDKPAVPEHDMEGKDNCAMCPHRFSQAPRFRR